MHPSDQSTSGFFKGWAIPGPKRPMGREPTLEEGESLDALSGHFRIYQLKKGHRYSTDDLIVAAYGTSLCPSASRVLELGSGIGTVGMIAAWRLVGASFVTVEAQDDSIRLARKAAWLNGLDTRFDQRQGDFRDAAVVADSELFDLVLGSPPYFPLGTGVLGDHPQKVACRFEVRGSIHDYCATASKHLAPGGLFACVFPVDPPHQRERVIAAAREAGLVIVRSRDVVLREGETPLLGLFAMMKPEHLPENQRGLTWKDPDLIVRTTKGDVHPEYQLLKLSIGFPPTQ